MQSEALHSMVRESRVKVLSRVSHKVDPLATRASERTLDECSAYPSPPVGQCDGDQREVCLYFTVALYITEPGHIFAVKCHDRGHAWGSKCAMRSIGVTRKCWPTFRLTESHHARQVRAVVWDVTGHLPIFVHVRSQGPLDTSGQVRCGSHPGAFSERVRRVVGSEAKPPYSGTLRMGDRALAIP